MEINNYYNPLLSIHNLIISQCNREEIPGAEKVDEVAQRELDKIPSSVYT